MSAGVLDTIARHAAERADRVVFTSETGRMTFGELAARSDALAAHLAAVMPPSAPVVVLGHKQPEMLVGFLACLKSGRAYIPVDDGIPQARLERILADSAAPLVLAPGDAQLAARHPAVLDRAAIQRIIDRRAGEASATRLEPDDTAYIIYTSGSTGEPKGVEITLSNLTGFIAWAIDAHGLAAGLRFLDLIPYSFDASCLAFYLPLMTGGTIHALERERLARPHEVRRALRESDAQVWTSTASVLHMCLLDRAISRELAPNLECVMMGGETLTPAFVRRIHERFPGVRVYDHYGQTETTVAMASLFVTPEVLARHETLPIGKVMPETRLLLLDADGQPVPDGTVGEIVIEGPCVGRGYRGNPELTAKAFSGTGASRRYRSGDGGCVIDGHVYFRGRIDAQIKLFGRRIELDDIAANLARIPAVALATAVPVIRDGTCQAIVGFVVLRDGAADTPQALRAALEPLLPDYMIPREIRICSALPITVNGKIDRARVAADLASETRRSGGNA